MYEVYVGNLSVAISHQNLKDLFAKAGEIVSIWICQKDYQRFTFAFIKFRYLDDAENASKLFDNANIDGLIIKVSVSKRTQINLAADVKPKKDGSLLLELPKREGKTKKRQLFVTLQRQILKKAYEKDKEFFSNYVSALKEIDERGIKSGKPCEIVKIEPEKPNLQSLEDIVLRYYQPSQLKTKIDIDIDLSKNKVLKSKDDAKFFNIAF